MENIGAPPISTTSSRNFFAPLLVSIIGIFCTGLALIIYHFILNKFCLRRHPQITNNNIDLQQIPAQTHLPKGVDQNILDKIPIWAYNSFGFFRLDQNECAVCLGELEDDEMVRLLPNCRHAFHVPCIDQWFVAQTSCPVCRSPVTEMMTHVMYLFDTLPLSSPSVLNEECNDSSSSLSSSSSGMKLSQKSHGMLRHCVSLVVPKERKLSSSLSSQRRLIPSMRRSLSIDNSFIVINREKEFETDPLLRSKSDKNSDGVSSKLLRSLSRLGKGSQIIPY